MREKEEIREAWKERDERSMERKEEMKDRENKMAMHEGERERNRKWLENLSDANGDEETFFSLFS